MDVWPLLEGRWPFSRELAEVAAINRRYGLRGDVAFDAHLRPVFFVGDIAGSPEFLSIGLKPGRNRDDTAGFSDEKAALSGTFADYRRSRETYFLSPALNRRHYSTLARVIEALLGESRIGHLGSWLHEHVVQAELLPFFAPSSGLSAREWLEVRRGSLGGQLADHVLRQLLEARPWLAVITRYQVTYEVFARVADVREAAGGPVVRVAGQVIPVIRVDGRNVSHEQAQAIGARFRSRGAAGRSRLPSEPAVARAAAAPTTRSDAVFLPESALGLRKRSGRRWSVAQAFVYGGTPSEIVDRARTFDRTRSADLGRPPAPDIEVDRRDLENPTGWYANHFRHLGWKVELTGGQWRVTAP